MSAASAVEPRTTSGRVVPAVLVALGAAAAVAGARYGVTVEGGRVGPGALPAGAGTLLAVTAGADLVRELRAGRATRPVAPHAGEEVPASAGALADVPAPDLPSAAADGVDIFGRDARQRLRLLVLVLAMLVGTLLLVPLVGFLLAFGAFLLVISTRLEGRRLLPAVLTTVAVVAATRTVFVTFLDVPLPSGLLGLL